MIGLCISDEEQALRRAAEGARSARGGEGPTE